MDVVNGCGKCGCGTGVRILPDGVNELDFCTYNLIEIHKNVDVHILRCSKCGHVEVEWFRTENTEDLFDDCVM